MEASALPLLGAVGEKGDKSDKEHVILLNDANTVQAEFRVGVGGKIGVGFKFADGKAQTVLGVVKADEMKRTVEKAGKTVPVGTPGELYHRPRTSFVADFIGHPNLMRGTLVGSDGEHGLVETGAGRFRANRNGDLSDGVTVSIRPEQMRIVTGRAASNGSTNRFVGKPIETTFLGEASEHVLDVNGQRVKVISAPPIFDVPSEIAVYAAISTQNGT